MKVCANLSFLFTESGNSLVEKYSKALAAGFKAVEAAFPYDVDVRLLQETLKKTGLKQVLINTFPGEHFGFAARRGEEAEFMTYLDRSLEYCEAMDVKLLHIMSGTAQEGVARSESLHTLESNLRLAVPKLQAAGVVGLLEPINPYSLPGYILNSYEDAIAIIRSINSPNLRLQLDLFHLQQISGNITRNLDTLLPFTSHIQVAQVPGRGEPNSNGEINYQYVFNALKERKYEGYIGLEYKSTMPQEDTFKWIKLYGLDMQE